MTTLPAAAPAKPIVVLFGRTNVGKSTLFNCLRETQQALVANSVGTTRDMNTGTVRWRGSSFTLVDTGGIIDHRYLIGKGSAANDIDESVQEQARDYLKRADLILFTVDSHTGPTAVDRELARYVRQLRKPVLVVANKADNPRLRAEAGPFVGLGLGDPLLVAATTGVGTGDLLDRVYEKLTTELPDDAPEEKPAVRVAIIGQPNVGKSSLVNAFLKEHKLIVSPTPHTTRESHDETFRHRDQLITLVDTAGITREGRKSVREKKARVTIEKQSIERSLYTIGQADVVLLVFEAGHEATREEGQLAQRVVDAGKSLIIVMNKWDIAPDRNPDAVRRQLYGKLPSLVWAPVEFVSALTREKTLKVLDRVLIVAAARGRTIAPSGLTRFLKGAVKHRLPTRGKGTRFPRIMALTQVASAPPVFAARLKEGVSLNAAYLVYLEHRLRDTFGFDGTPVTVYVEKRTKGVRKKKLSIR